MNPRKPNNPRRLPDFDPELEDDAVWNLLDQATRPDISPRFTEDTLRRCRLETGSPKSRWWQTVFSPKPLAGAAGAALAVIAIVIFLPGDPSPVPTQTGTTPETPGSVENWETLEDSLAHELLSEAADDPTLLSDEELVSLLF